MTDLEPHVAAHYTSGSLYQRIVATLEDLGVDLDAASADALKPVDEFHTGGIEATEALLDQLDINKDTRILDIGSGLGGTARAISSRFGGRVTGIDLTPEFVETADALSRLVGLEAGTAFKVGSALDLPFDDDAFDIVTMLHVGMNIADKAALFGETGRVLVPGGTFAVFDVMRGNATSDLVFPVPWSTTAETSFVDSPRAYRDEAASADFEVVAQRDRSTFAKNFFERVRAMIEDRGGPPPLGIHLIMGDTAGEKIDNYVAMLEDDRIVPMEMIFRYAPGA